MSKAFRKCVELVEEMVKEGYRLQIPSTHVERLVKVNVGADKRTVQKYLKLLIDDLGFLKTVAKNPVGIYVYRIDIDTIEHYIGEYMKEKLSQLTLLDPQLREREAG